MASISISYLYDLNPDPKKYFRVWHDGLIVGQFENRQEAELLKNYYNEIKNQTYFDQGNQREPKQSS
jgi:hypothetical protein